MFLRSLLLLCLPLLACSGSSLPEKNVETENKTSGLISLHPAITETIFYLGAQDKLIGRSDYCTNPSEAEKLAKFGTSFTPNLEAIAKEKPQGIFADQSIAAQNNSLKQLTTVHELAWQTKEDIESSIATLGQILEVRDAADALVLQFQQNLAAARQPQNKESVLMIMLGSDIQKGQIWYIRKDSLHGTALEAAGYHNAAPEVKTTPSMSLEELIAINPDIILLMGTDALNQKTVEDTISILRQLPQLNAAQRNHIARIHMHNVHGIGPGILELPQNIIKTIESLPHK